MLAIDNKDTHLGVEIYGDNEDFALYYLLPNKPRYKYNDDGTLAFAFYKYRMPIDRADGKKGGGYLAFDVEFVVPEDKEASIREYLQPRVNAEAARRGVPTRPVKIGTITYSKGETQLLIAGSDGIFVEKLNNPGMPSLYGNNVTTISVELTPEGATFFEQAMQGKGGSVSVIYKLEFWTQLPPLEVTGSFISTAFYSFYQSVDIDWNLWSEDEYRETVREQMIMADALRIEVTAPPGFDEKVKQEVKDWALRTMEDAVERRMIESIAPVTEDQRKVPDGIENLTRDISSTKVSSFTLNFKENQGVEWKIAPQGMLSNITSMTEKNGNPVKWSDYARVIDLDDPFFKKLDVSVFINADFEALPLNSVEVKVDYNGKPMHPGEHRFTSPNDVGKYASFIEGDNWKYKYSYQINYKGQSRIFQSQPVETDEAILTIGVDDVGILSVDIAPGDLNFAQVQQAQLTMRYEDAGAGVNLIEQQFTLDRNNPKHKFQHVIFAPRRRPYQYKVKYFMANGKELETAFKDGNSPNLYINDPFSATKTVGIRAAGNLDTDINTIFLDLTYRDAANDYTQTQTVALSKTQPFFDWAIPVINENGGVVTYAGNIQFKNGTVEAIPQTTAAQNTILVGKIVRDKLEVTVIPDLIDFTQVKLAQVSLTYDDGSGAPKRKAIIFKPNAMMQVWQVDLADPSKTEYEWKADYFMQNGSSRSVGPVKTSDLTIVLEVPVPVP